MPRWSPRATRRSPERRPPAERPNPPRGRSARGTASRRRCRCSRPRNGRSRRRRCTRPAVPRPGGRAPLALARPADDARRVAVHEIDRGSPARERCPCRDHRELSDSERLERRLDEEAVAVGHDLDRDAGSLCSADERHERRVVRLTREGRSERRGRRRSATPPRPSVAAIPSGRRRSSPPRLPRRRPIRTARAAAR